MKNLPQTLIILISPRLKVYAQFASSSFVVVVATCISALFSLLGLVELLEVLGFDSSSSVSRAISVKSPLLMHSALYAA